MGYTGLVMPQEFPKLRPLNVRWITWRGQPVLSLSDPLRLAGGTALVPQAVAPLLALCDGTRDSDALRAGFMLRTGSNIMPSQVEELIRSLDEALLLDSPRFRQVLSETREAYRAAPFRKPALAGGGYPADPRELLDVMDAYCRESEGPVDSVAGVQGVVSPHIDYTRGWRTYARTWIPLRQAVEDAELVIILGTDHSGSPGSLTLTRQSYATPWGTLPTDTGVVDRVAGVLGEEAAFSQEVHHVGEHSIELAAVWLHYMAGREPKRVVPVLCGAHESLLEAGDGEASRVWQAVDVLAEEARGGATLVVAAGDLSHVGPAFGDPDPLDHGGQGRDTLVGRKVAGVGLRRRGRGAGRPHPYGGGSDAHLWRGPHPFHGPDAGGGQGRRGPLRPVSRRRGVRLTGVHSGRALRLALVHPYRRTRANLRRVFTSRGGSMYRPRMV